MQTNYLTDELSFDSLKQDVQGYSLKTLFQDVWAGLPVALLTVPQAMAFALAAGLPLSAGIFSAIYAAMIASLFCSCRQMIVGPNNTIALLIQIATLTVLYHNYHDVSGPEREAVVIGILTQLTLLVGFFQLIAAFFRLGRLTQFVSHSVVVGYMAGTALSLVVSQLFAFTGMPRPERASSMWSAFSYFLKHIELIHIPTLIIGLGSLLLLAVLTRTSKKIPAAVFVLIVMASLVHFLGISSYSEMGLLSFQSSNVALVGDLGLIQDIVPVLYFPMLNMELMNDLIPIAFAIALLSSLETTMVAKTITMSTGQPLSIDQELFGLGVANFFASFFGGMPSSGSVSRSIILFQSGGKTHFSGVFSALWVASMFVIFGYFVQRVPITALSAILIFSAGKIVNRDHLLLCFKATRSDALVLLTTVLSCFFIGLDVAFYIGVAFSITLYLQKASVPHFVECVYDDTGAISSSYSAGSDGKGQIRVINVQGELFFGAADLFQNTLKSLTKADSDLKVVVLRLKNARDIDATACLALQQLSQYLRETGRYLLLCGLTYPTWEVLSYSGTLEKIGKENLFITEEQHPKRSLQKALYRARLLVELDLQKGKEPVKQLAQEAGITNLKEGVAL